MSKTLMVFSLVLFLLAVVIVIWASYFRGDRATDQAIDVTASK
jgi:hypothetical protein